MLDYPLDLLARVVDAPAPPGKERRVQRVSIDSRTVEPGDLFVAVPGEKFDGHDFVADALRKGAAGALVQAGRLDSAQVDGPLVPVPDPVLALGQLAAWHRNRFRELRVVAVTGSVGKTTTKDFLAGVLSTQFRTLKSPASHNAELGLPLALLALEARHQAAVVEMAMRGPGQIRYLARIARPDLAVITRIGLSHIELLGSQEAIAAAKAEVLDFLPIGATAVLNAEDDFMGFLGSRVPDWAFTRYFGLDIIRSRDTVAGTYCGVGPREEEPDGPLGSRFTVRFASGNPPASGWLPLPGRHNVRNALAAAAVGSAMGISWARILQGLAEAEVSGMRMAVHRFADGGLLIDDAYNASSPEAVIAALEVLQESPGRRKLAVLGDMLELGPRSEEAHRLVGQFVASVGPAALITLGERARVIARSAEASGLKDVVPGATIVSCDDPAQVVDHVRRIRRPGDAVLVKGSRGMAMERVVKPLLEPEAR